MNAEVLTSLVNMAAALIGLATALCILYSQIIKTDNSGSIRRKTFGTIKASIRVLFIGAAAVALIHFNRYGIAALLILAVTASDSRDFLRLPGPPTREEIFFFVLQWVGALAFLMTIMGAILLTLIEGNTERIGQNISTIHQLTELLSSLAREIKK